MSFVQPLVMRHNGVRLEPLALSHEDGLRAAAADGELWKLRITSVPEPHETRAYIETALKMRADGQRKSVQRSHVNTIAKLLMMGHAFDQLGCNVVGWRTDNYNFASQRAIERLGAKKDGVIRGHALRRDGTIRDTVMYSMRSGEWPEARAQLLYLLERHTLVT